MDESKPSKLLRFWDSTSTSCLKHMFLRFKFQRRLYVFIVCIEILEIHHGFVSIRKCLSYALVVSKISSHVFKDSSPETGGTPE